MHRLRKILVKQLRQTKAAAGEHHGIAEVSGSEPPVAKTRCAHTHLCAKKAASSHIELCLISHSFSCEFLCHQFRTLAQGDICSSLFLMQFAVHTSASHVPCNMVRLGSACRPLCRRFLRDSAAAEQEDGKATAEKKLVATKAQSKQHRPQHALPQSASELSCFAMHLCATQPIRNTGQLCEAASIFLQLQTILACLLYT